MTSTGRVDRICTNPALINSVAVQDERDNINKHLPIDRIVKYDHNMAGYSPSLGNPTYPGSNSQLEIAAKHARRMS